MAVVNDTTLKTYFNTSDNPTEQQFINLIDSSKRYDNEEVVSIATEGSIVTSTIYLLFIADRNVDIQYFSVLADSSITISFKLRKNSGGTLSDLTATSSTVPNFTSASSFPSETITSSSVSAGDAVYVDVSSGDASANKVSFVVRYK